jgi:choline kinase
MQIVFLAAGKGSRIFSKIKKNKCLIKLNGKSLIKRLISNALDNKIKKINIVVGFKKEKIIKETKNYKINYIENKNYKTTEMLHSLILAIKEVDDDLIISYADIIYSNSILNFIKKMNYNYFSMPILKNWKNVWKIRGKLVSDDVESLKVKNNFLVEVGRQVLNQKDVEGQYMGILFIPRSKRNKIIKFYERGNNQKIQITQFINNFLKFIKCRVIPINKSWYEFDDLKDLKNFKKNFSIDNKNNFIKK